LYVAVLNQASLNSAVPCTMWWFGSIQMVARPSQLLRPVGAQTRSALFLVLGGRPIDGVGAARSQCVLGLGRPGGSRTA
jgi:hypothetical protein